MSRVLKFEIWSWHLPDVSNREAAARFEPRLRALFGYTAHGSGDDLIGYYRGDCPAWVEAPPEKA